MLLAALFILASAAQAGEAPDDRPITVVGRPWAPFISPMGEPFRARSRSDNTLALWFNQADRDRDGAITPAEMLADAERFFARLDEDGNGEIEPEELVRYEWEVAPEIQVNSKWRRTAAEASVPMKRKGRNTNVGGYLVDPLEGGARYALLNIPQPVAAADADLNRGISLSEFRHAATQRFHLLDRTNQGRLTLPELQALVPVRPERGKRRRVKDKEPDARVGVALPPGD